MPPALTEALQQAAELARQEGPLRDCLRCLARAFLDMTETALGEAPPTAPPSAPPSAEDAVAEDRTAPSPPEAEAPAPPAEETPQRILSIRDFVFQPRFTEPKDETPPPPPAEAPARPAAGSAEPSDIAAQCRLKADAVRWRLRRSLDRGAALANDNDPEYAALIERARQLQCFLWMVREEAGLERDPIAAERLAGCFEATGRAAALAGMALPLRERLRDTFLQVLDLFAEAQSALRVAVRVFHPQGDDDAQLASFLWLKSATAHYQFYVRRHMKVDDPANPAGWPEIVRRLQALEPAVADLGKRSGQSKKLLGKLRHKVSVLQRDPDNHADDWRILAETVDLLVSAGVPPSSLEIRDPLLPLVDHFPPMEGQHPGFDRALREIERYLASQPVPTEPPAPRIDPLVEQAAGLIEGKSVLLIGGVPNPAARVALREALRLREVYWPETREHQSIASFEADIARPEVCLVLLAIRWSSHSFGDVKQWCDEHDKPLVRLPRGYNSSQVAKEILDQASERLKRGGS